MLHNTNIFIHVSAGMIALIIGTVILILPKFTRTHRKLGKIFIGFISVVVATGFIGWLFFRSNAFLFMLTLLAGYNTFSGYRIVQTKNRRQTVIDFLIGVTSLALGLFYMVWLMNHDTIWNPSVIYATVGNLALVTGYDIVKYLFFQSRVSHWWLYEHIYKIISAFGALLSAFVGTVLPDYKPYSQVGPGVFCIALIVYMILRTNRHGLLNKQPL